VTANGSERVRFSVVIPTLMRTTILAKTVANLVDCNPPPDEVILVDADGDGSARRLADEQDARRERPVVRYLSTPASLTFQRNRGIDEARGDVIVFLDDDVAVPPDVFSRLAEAYADPSIVGATGRVVEPHGKRIGGVGSRLRALFPGTPPGRFTRFGYPRYVREAETPPAHVEYMLGCFMSARRDVAAAVRFDEALGGYALAEDEDFSYRLSREGPIRYLPDIVVHHEKFGFSSKDPLELNRLVVRNRAYLFRKNFAHTRRARAEFRVFVAALLAHRLLNREWRAARGLVEGVLAARRERRRG
jgi:GT2 family glycosyltransferase